MSEAEGKWVTLHNGVRVFIQEGQSVNDAIANRSGKAEENDIFKRDRFFQEEVFNKLPKKMQVKNITSISKERHGSDGTRYNASIVWEDGHNRSVSEYGWSDFKDYLKTVLFEDRDYHQ